MLIRTLLHILISVVIVIGLQSTVAPLWRDLLVISNQMLEPVDDPAYHAVFVQIDDTFLDPDLALAMQFKRWGDLLERIHQAKPAVLMVDYQFSPKRFESVLPGEATRFEQRLLKISRYGGLIMGLSPQSEGPDTRAFTLREVEQNTSLIKACMALNVDEDQVVRHFEPFPSPFCPRNAQQSMAAAAAQYLNATIQHEGLILTRGLNSVVEISAAQLLTQTGTDNRLEGAIVVVGSNFQFEDELMSVHQRERFLAHARMKGGLVHALNTEAVLENRIAWLEGEYWIYLLLPIALLVLVWPVRGVTAPTTLLLLGTVILLIEMIAVNQHRVYFDAITLALFCLAGGLVLTASRVLDALLLKRKIQNLLGGLLSPAVFQQCIKDPDLFMQTRRFESASVLVLDLQGYSRDATSQSVENLYANTNALLAASTKIIHQHGGCVERFRGDGLLAYFGAPIPSTNPLGEALNAAKDILTLLHKTNTPVLSQFNQRIRIGISSGEVILGQVGDPERFDLAVTGLAANRAAHFESLADPVTYPVVVDHASLGTLGESWSLHTLGLRHPKHPDFELTGLGIHPR